MTSTVALNAGCPASAATEVDPNGEAEPDEPVRGRGLSGAEGGSDTRPRNVVEGVMLPGVAAPATLGRCNASPAARRRRFVVPSALVEPERAEQTTATLCWSK